MTTPDNIRSDTELDDFMSTPQQETIDMMKRLKGDIMILGIGGKMGPTLGMTALKACAAAGVDKKIYGVSRFSDKSVIPILEKQGISCITCDLMKPSEIECLPRVDNIIFMAGRKFGQVGSDHLTWALNTVVPANLARHFTDSRFVVFSTGSIYSLYPVDSDGPSETDNFTSIGEYANSCLGRERIFEYYSRTNGTKVLIYRLNYAIDLRYGVLFEIGRQIHEGIPIDISMGHANVIWQGDANNVALRGLELANNPPEILNVSGGKILIKDIAKQFGLIMGKTPEFTGTEAPSAFLTNTAKMNRLLGEPPTALSDMIEWIADWIMHDGRSLGKPTHYQTRDGQFLDD